MNAINENEEGVDWIYLLAALEHSPVHPTQPPPPNLRGWWIHCKDTPHYLCAHCVGRLLARGVFIGPGHQSVWRDRPDAFALCPGCHPHNKTQ